MARLDESREGAMIQVVDIAQTPEWKSKPKRAQIAIGAFVVTAIVLLAFVLIRGAWRQTAMTPESSARIARLRAALGFR
jgi:uncharacterized protein involved in exopolysaccharide biosynthesis